MRHCDLMDCRNHDSTPGPGATVSHIVAVAWTSNRATLERVDVKMTEVLSEHITHSTNLLK
ncbi:hypothetical protein F2Q69_00056098 [Brassica cretica]|uniref:Uncharacterized protein n=1 Tax=Brassica cretica TaxID=69181 RepID=A0A8S9N502_BRACR|nr:hypothetical protein F2Q69_00056098 [Brassica cretica]